MQPLTERTSNTKARKVSSWLGGIALLAITLACKYGVDEMRPGIFDRPFKTEVHGRIVEQYYHYYNGPRTHSYSMLEVDGKQLRVPGGAVKESAFCEVDGVEAVAFTARGSNPAIYILQLNGNEMIFERLCDYGSLGRWHGSMIPACEIGWDAIDRKRVNVGWDSEKDEYIFY